VSSRITTLTHAPPAQSNKSGARTTLSPSCPDRHVSSGGSAVSSADPGLRLGQHFEPLAWRVSCLGPQLVEFGVTGRHLGHRCKGLFTSAGEGDIRFLSTQDDDHAGLVPADPLGRAPAIHHRLVARQSELVAPVPEAEIDGGGRAADQEPR